MSNKVLVVGSINIDVVIRVKNIPAPGETLPGEDPVFLQGGKGGNQAVSAAHNGAQVSMISAVGSDQFGRDAINSLKQYGISTDAVEVKPGATGTAYIYVDESGENSIVVTAGANGKVEAQFVAHRIEKLENEKSIVLAQMELPQAVVKQAAISAEKIGARFILNLAPAIEIDNNLLKACDPIVVNETEAEFLTGEVVDNVDQAKALVEKLATKAKSAVITLGADGAVFSDGSTSRHFPSEKVEVIDTTGAGDAFVGALAAAFANEKTLEEAVKAGLRAGAKAVQHFGAQPPRA